MAYIKKPILFQINAAVLTSDGGTVSTGAIVNCNPYTNAISDAGSLPCDLNWWISLTAATNKWDNVIACSDAARTNKLISVYLQIDISADQITYVYVQGLAKTYLEGIYGVGNVIAI